METSMSEERHDLPSPFKVIEQLGEINAHNFDSAGFLQVIIN